MKLEDKKLLFRYLSMALPYGIILRIAEHDVKLSFKNTWVYFGLDDEAKEYIKPYLRPMSSMTKEEDKERIQLGIWRSSQANGHEITRICPDTSSEIYDSQPFQKALDFLLKSHLDIFGLIPKGLAIAVTEENNPYSTKKK